MSGAAGGVIINKEDLKATIRDYRETVLKPLNLDKSYNITGVRRRPEKNTFGDIDIVLSFPGGDKKQLNKDFAQHLEQLDKIPSIPRKKNKKYFILICKIDFGIKTIQEKIVDKQRAENPINEIIFNLFSTDCFF